MKKKTTDEVLGFKLEHNVPMPLKLGPRALKYPWRQMKVGDSVFVAGVKQGTIGSSLLWAKTTMGGGANFATRTVEGGVRVWRTA